MMAFRMDIPICDKDCTNVPNADEIVGAMIVCFKRSSVPQSAEVASLSIHILDLTSQVESTTVI